MRKYITTDYCKKCGCSPEAAEHIFDHKYVPPDKAMRKHKLSRLVLDRLARVEHIRARYVPNSDSWEIYNEDTREVLATVGKEELEAAEKRLKFQKTQKKRRAKADW